MARCGIPPVREAVAIAVFVRPSVRCSSALRGREPGLHFLADVKAYMSVHNTVIAVDDHPAHRLEADRRQSQASSG